MNLRQPYLKQSRWELYDLGLVPYGEALQLQYDLHQEIQHTGSHKILLLQHPSVITLGRRTAEEHLLESQEELIGEGYDVYRVDRGGSATYHGPGQLVGYVICKVSRVGGIHELVERILKAVRQTVTDFGIPAKIDYDNPGIWTDSEVPRKLAAVGMQNKMGYSLHGFALNVDLPLTGFSKIVPCGLHLPVSTMAIELGKSMEVSSVIPTMSDNLLAQLS